MRKKVIFNLQIIVLEGDVDIPQKQELIDFARRFSGEKHIDEMGWIFPGSDLRLPVLQKLKMILRVEDNLTALKNHIDFYNLPLGIPYGDSRPYIILESGTTDKTRRFHDIELSFDNFQKRWKFNWAFSPISLLI